MKGPLCYGVHCFVQGLVFAFGCSAVRLPTGDRVFLALFALLLFAVAVADQRRAAARRALDAARAFREREAELERAYAKSPRQESGT